MKTFADMEGFIREILNAGEFPEAKWPIQPGPKLPAIPGSFVLVSPYGGPGEDLEGLLDQRSWQIRVVGEQNDYTGAESAANAIDLAYLSHLSHEKIAGQKVTSITRVGGPPAVLQVDDADRVHFVCSYTFSVELALAN